MDAEEDDEVRCRHVLRLREGQPEHQVQLPGLVPAHPGASAPTNAHALAVFDRAPHLSAVEASSDALEPSLGVAHRRVGQLCGRLHPARRPLGPRRQTGVWGGGNAGTSLIWYPALRRPLEPGVLGARLESAQRWSPGPPCGAQLHYL